MKHICDAAVWICLFALMAFGVHQCTVIRLAGLQ